MAIGVAILKEPTMTKFFSFSWEATGDELIKYAAYLMLGAGGFVFLVGLCGCTGAFMHSKPLLSFYILLLLLVMAGEIVAGVMFLIFKDKVVDEIGEWTSKKMKESPYNETNPNAFWGLMLTIQSEFKCCGLSGPTDYSTIINFHEKYNLKYPYTCCEEPKNNYTAKPIVVGSQTRVDCRNDIYQPMPKGCLEKIHHQLKSHSTWIMASAFGLAAFNIFGLMLAIILCRVKKPA